MISFERPVAEGAGFVYRRCRRWSSNGEPPREPLSVACRDRGAGEPAYKDVQVAIIQFLDRFNFDLGAVKRSCIHFATADGRLIPFDTYNSFYRPGAPGAAKLREKGGIVA